MTRGRGALPGHLQDLEAEAIAAFREGVAEARAPVLLFSGGKDSTVLAHLALRAFHPAPPPLPLLHVDSTWEFRELIEFRDAFARQHGFRLVVHANEEGRAQGVNPFEHGETYTTLMRTDALRQALDQHGFDVIFGGARRDEDPARAKERLVSLRNRDHGWEPRRQRPELWQSWNFRKGSGESLRVYPLSNWTEEDLWIYVLLRGIELAPLYRSAMRPVVERDGTLIVVDEPARMRWRDGERVQERRVRFRTLGCWPVTGAVESAAADVGAIVLETLGSRRSERQGRISDNGSLEAQKRAGYY